MRRVTEFVYKAVMATRNNVLKKYKLTLKGSDQRKVNLAVTKWNIDFMDLLKTTREKGVYLKYKDVSALYVDLEQRLTTALGETSNAEIAATRTHFIQTVHLEIQNKMKRINAFYREVLKQIKQNRTLKPKHTPTPAGVVPQKPRPASRQVLAAVDQKPTQVLEPKAVPPEPDQLKKLAQQGGFVVVEPNQPAHRTDQHVFNLMSRYAQEYQWGEPVTEKTPDNHWHCQYKVDKHFVNVDIHRGRIEKMTTSGESPNKFKEMAKVLYKTLPANEKSIELTGPMRFRQSLYEAATAAGLEVRNPPENENMPGIDLSAL